MEALPAIIGSVIGAILNFLSKAAGFIAKHTWSLTIAVGGLIGLRLMKKIYPPRR